MALKKQNFNDDEEVAIFDEAVVYKRGEYWHFRLWLNDERKYARKSLRTRSKTTAIEKAKEWGYPYLTYLLTAIMQHSFDWLRTIAFHIPLDWHTPVLNAVF